MSNIEPPNQVITTVDEPTPMSPLTRVIRTAVQVALALAAAIPTMAALFNVSAETSAKLTAGMGVLVTLVSALHNAFNARQAATADRGDINLTTLFLVLALVCFVIFTLIAHGTIKSDEGFTWLGGAFICWVLAILLPSVRQP